MRKGTLRLKLEDLTPTEAELQRSCVKGLRMRGHIVMETGTPRRAIRCPACHSFFTPSGGAASNNTPGTPDLIVVLRDAPTLIVNRYGATVRLALLVELKASEKAPVGEAQELLAKAGASVVLWTLEDVLEAVETASKSR